MSNIEHLIENGLIAADKAIENNKDAGESFRHEMEKPYNKDMLMNVSVTQAELWEIVSYILFVWEEK